VKEKIQAKTAHFWGAGKAVWEKRLLASSRPYVLMGQPEFYWLDYHEIL
jgi:hypothetical protein